MTMTVERLTPIGAVSTWGRPMPAWYWDLRNTRQAELHFGWGPSPVALGECSRLTGRGFGCSLCAADSPACYTRRPYGWPRRPLNLRHPHRRSTLTRRLS